jgi:hypothetical protein
MRTATLRLARGAALAGVMLSLLLSVSLLPAAGQGAVSYTRESFQAFEEQLKSSQIREATINKRLRSLRLTLRDGRHVLAQYAPHEEPRVLAELRARSVPVSVLGGTKAKPAKKAVHHKLRYIAGGIVIAVVVVVGAVMLYNRRRRAPAAI